jgi:hypothetical protein
MITVQSYINSFFARPVFLYPSTFCSTWNGIQSCFLFCSMVPNKIPRVCLYFCSTELNSKLFSLPWKGSERNSKTMLLIFSTERNSELFSLPRKGLEWNSARFLFHGTAGIPLKITICSVYSIFRGIVFLSEIPNPNLDTDLDTDPDPVLNQGF